LRGLTELDAANKSITNLNGLEYCTSLTQLWLDNNQISDIEPLVNNPGLEARGIEVLL
jgi:Leucine-rich repeat (LRR) protein